MLAVRIRKMAKRITKLEGKKSQVSYGNVLEVLRVMATLEATDMIKGRPTANRPSQIMASYCGYAVVKGMQILKKQAKKKKAIRILRRKKTVKRRKK